MESHGTALGIFLLCVCKRLVGLWLLLDSIMFTDAFAAHFVPNILAMA
jgi:hypothetical protein